MAIAVRTGEEVDTDLCPSPIFTLSDLVRGQVPPIPWIVENLIPEASVCLLAGDSGVGKSWLSFHLALSIAGGIPLFGKFKTSAGRVLCIDAESGENLLIRRFKKLWNGIQEEHPDLSDELPLEVWPTLFRLTEKGCLALTERIKRDGIRLVILDPMIHFADCDENSSHEMANFLERLRVIARETECSFLLVHHVRKESRLSSNAAGQMIRVLLSYSRCVGLLSIRSEVERRHGDDNT